MPIKVKRNGAWVEVYGGAEEGIGTKNFVIPIEHSLDNDSNDVYTLGETYSYSDLIAAINDGNEISCRITSKQSRSVILLPLIEYSMKAGLFKFSGLYNEQLITVTITNINDDVLVEYINPNVNADWNQTDENAFDYIKNRTHHIAKLGYTVEEEATKEITDTTYLGFTKKTHLGVYNLDVEPDCCSLIGFGATSPYLPFDRILTWSYGGPGFSFALNIVQTDVHSYALYLFSDGSFNTAMSLSSAKGFAKVNPLDLIYLKNVVSKEELDRAINQIQGGITVTDKNSDGNIVISNLLPTSTYAENLSF